MQNIQTSSLTERLQTRRQQATAEMLLPRAQAHTWLEQLLGLLFPHLDKQQTGSDQVPERLGQLEQALANLLSGLGQPPDIASRFFNHSLPEIDTMLLEDAESICQGDPAAGSVDEVILAYPGFLAVAIYRLAHALGQQGVPVLPRLLTEYGHQLTGIDIHPGARIGHRFVIDHGTGVVIGESTWIGNDVKLYQGVTLGAASVDKQMAHTKRHPTIEDRVVIYANATILGGDTIVGHDSIIGGNVWLTRSVEPESLVYHTPQIQVRPQKSFPLEYMI